MRSQLSRSIHAALTSQLWKCLKIADAANDRRRDILCRTWTTRCDVIADAFEILGCVLGPADAHQPR
jgi:hypothetical protein